jgi:hypothetical protein
MMSDTFPLKSWIRSVMGAGSVLVGASAMALGCDSSNAPVPVTDSGTPAKDAAADGATASGNDAAADGATDAGSTLFERLGGHAGIRSAVDAIVAQELQDPNIASYFFFQGGAPGNGHPTADQIEECFTYFVGNAVGGPAQPYPTTVADEAGSFTCRDLRTIHAPLLISGGTFDDFIMIAGSTLTSLGTISSADVNTLANALIGTKPLIETASLADAGVQMYPGDGSASP